MRLDIPRNSSRHRLRPSGVVAGEVVPLLLARIVLYALLAAAALAAVGGWAAAQEASSSPPTAPVAASPQHAGGPAVEGTTGAAIGAASGPASEPPSVAPADPFAPVPGPSSAPEPGTAGPAPPSGAVTPNQPTGAGQAAASAVAALPPRPAAPPVQRPLTVHNGNVTLQGTLLLPPGNGPFPGVVLLPGRGSASREQAAADARLFATHGVAAYAYDKRGTGTSSGDWRASLNIDDEVGDAVAAVAALRRQADIDPSRVGVWGVGQGAWLAPFVGEHADVAFLILLNTSAAPLGQEEVWRAGDAVRAQGYSATAADAAMRGVRLLVSTRPVLAALLPRSELGFLRSDPAQSPVDALKQARAPALLVFDDLDPHAPGVKSTAALLRATQQRDQPLDHVTVLGLPAAGDAAGTGGTPSSAAVNARRAADATYRSVVVGWTTTVIASLAAPVSTGATGSSGSGPTPLLAASGTRGPASTPTSGVPAAGTGDRAPAADPSLMVPGASDRPAPWYASPWLQLGAVVFFLIAFGEGLVMAMLPLRRRSGSIPGRGTSTAPAWGALMVLPERARSDARTAQLLRLAQALVSLVDLALLVGSTMAIAFLLGLYRPTGLALEPLAEGLRALSAVSGTLAVALAVLILLARRAGAMPPRTAVAVVVAVAAALFLPFLVYWHVPFLAG